MSTHRVGEVDLAYEIRGTEGDPVALLHGSLADRHSFDRVVPKLSQALQVLSYDRRGYGGSRGPPRARPVVDDAQDLAGLLEGANFYPVHVIAHSYAGAVAFRLAIDRPELVRSISVHEPPFFGLLLDDPATRPEGEAFVRGLAELRAGVAIGRRAEVTRAVVEVFSDVPDAWDRLTPAVRAAMEAMIDEWAVELGDPAASRPDASELRDLLVPVLVTTGGRSPSYLAQVAHRLAADLRNATVEVLSGAGHVPQLTAPDLYVGHLVTFLLERNVPTR